MQRLISTYLFKQERDTETMHSLLKKILCFDKSTNKP